MDSSKLLLLVSLTPLGGMSMVTDWVLQKSGYASNFWVLRDWTTDSWVHAQSPSHWIRVHLALPFPSTLPPFLPRRRGTAPVSVPRFAGYLSARKLRWVHRLAKNGPALRKGWWSPFQFLHHHFHYKGTKDEKYWKVTFSPPSFQLEKPRLPGVISSHRKRFLISLWTLPLANALPLHTQHIPCFRDQRRAGIHPKKLVMERWSSGIRQWMKYMLVCEGNTEKFPVLSF